MVNSSASAAAAWRDCKSAMKAGTSAWHMAAWWPRVSRRRFGKSWSKWPRHRAAQPLRLGGIKHTLDPAAKAVGGFGLVIPERLENRKYVIGGDPVHWQAPQRSGIVPQYHDPLPEMFAVAPRRPHGLNYPVGAFPERGAFYGLPGVLWIYALGKLCAGLRSKLASASKRDVAGGTEPYFGRLAMPAEQEHPPPAAIR
jgi:hypothetical protein